ncbi:pentatricopeptide repeat-containing protein 2, mitochondrial-like [Hylaeus volcanicus]|uniref:pentatricopeptide repeat-containing protein 2, mitochondrial-like n=1 Tax=Hylaeus volcanicus TaxID=313075 RepID=UPI0023B78F3A|nr:pentatricopeptide repeat-containing protein 2, mitochondrial-like [Hylaeus volcanicus]
MAINIRGLFRLNLGLTHNIFCKTPLTNGVRFMYSEKYLGVSTYENTRFIFRNQFVTIEETFRSKMLEVCKAEDGVVFVEDVKAMLHLAQNNDDDIKLVTQLIEKYVNCIKDQKFGSYVFGPVVMRMFYYLNKPEAALSLFQNPLLDEFFQQKTTIQILFTLLYKHDKFNEIVALYEHLMSSEKKSSLARFCIIVVMAACYKQNNPESFNFAVKCWEQHQGKCLYFARSLEILAALAIRQNEPQMALELLSSLHRQQYITIRCLKILAYSQWQKYIYIIPLLKSTLDVDNSAQKQTYFADVIYQLEENLKTESGDWSELLDLIENIKNHDGLTTHATLEEHLLKPLVGDQKYLQDRDGFRQDREKPLNRNFGNRMRLSSRNQM